MNGLKKLLTTTLLFTAVLFTGMTTQAMPIRDFDRMSNQDRQNFMDLLPKVAETLLRQQGRTEDAEKVHHLFNDIPEGAHLSAGVAELEANLDNARIRDARKDPSAFPEQVEAALISTLRKNQIAVDRDFATSVAQLTRNFKARDPLQNQTPVLQRPAHRSSKRRTDETHSSSISAWVGF